MIKTDAQEEADRVILHSIDQAKKSFAAGVEAKEAIACVTRATNKYHTICSKDVLLKKRALRIELGLDKKKGKDKTVVRVMEAEAKASMKNTSSDELTDSLICPISLCAL